MGESAVPFPVPKNAVNRTVSEQLSLGTRMNDLPIYPTAIECSMGILPKADPLDGRGRPVPCSYREGPHSVQAQS